MSGAWEGSTVGHEALLDIGPFLPLGGEGTEPYPPDTAVPTEGHRFAFTVTRSFCLSNVCICTSSFIVHTMSSNVPQNLLPCAAPWSLRRGSPWASTPSVPTR